MALAHVDDLEEREVGERFGWLLRHYVAIDSEQRERGVFLWASDGKRRIGRPRHYYVMAPHNCPPRWQGESTHVRAFGLTAWNDDDAIATANARLVKWLAKGLRYDQKTDRWIASERSASDGQQQQR